MTYDYVCTACAQVWEAEQRITEAPLTECPHCHAQAAKRQVSGGQGFILKGGGWYSDLYSSAKPGAGKSESTPTSSAPAKAEKKSDATTSACASGACGTAACPAAAAN
jgi:putative FmdB family regulatory protein